MSDQLTRAELEQKIVGRAWKDDAFRQEFLANPKGTVEKYTGAKLPADLQIHAHQEDASTMHLRIPQAPAKVAELSDADLEAVAGGTGLGGPGAFQPMVTITVTNIPVGTVISAPGGRQGW